MPRRVARARKFPAVGLALTGILATAAIALAGTPVKGAHYSGDVKAAAGLTVSFRISSTGKKIKGLRIKPTIPNTCGYGGPLPAERSRPAAIDGGSFDAVVKLKGGGGSAKVHGVFLRHHRERGKIRSSLPAAQMCNGTFVYSTRAR